jgi:hypothetical protein
MKKERSPRECKNEKQLCQLRRDNFEVNKLSILVSDKHVNIHYADGKWLEIPKRTFDPIVDFYNRPQPI